MEHNNKRCLKKESGLAQAEMEASPKLVKIVFYHIQVFDFKKWYSYMSFRHNFIALTSPEIHQINK